MMKLLRFRVTHFRSVADSGWIDADDVTALIGANESGKTNLLLPLWKLNPAQGGELHPSADFPRSQFTDLRNLAEKPFFVEALFEASPDVAAEVAEAVGIPTEAATRISVLRRLDGRHVIRFPDAAGPRLRPAASLAATLTATANELRAVNVSAADEPNSSQLLRALEEAGSALAGAEWVDAARVEALREALLNSMPAPNPITPSSPLAPWTRLLEKLHQVGIELSVPVGDGEREMSSVLGHMPKFVYYSNYGNLDSEIYLPQVIQNLGRQDLGAKEQAKARTLKVLFEFVGLKPQEIHDLGREVPPNRQSSREDVEVAAERKKQRSILLQSASTKLTKRFREWWRQGTYRFRFEADGDHFRIWVSDDKRPDEVELEGRSTGLQWFLSFFLVFLVESADSHDGAVLLLDEPGHSLHPLAQRDLSAFFDGLAATNQLLFTTHSPFLVDADRLERVRKVYVAPDGSTKATPDLRAPDGDAAQRGAGYAVHAALGLTVAETLLLGCTLVVVEGPSDQHYLSAIKTVLIRQGLLKPSREIVFTPAGGAKGIKAVAGVLGTREGELPVALIDSDRQGREAAQALRTTLYVGSADRVLEVGRFLPTILGAEVEDFLPAELMAAEIDRWIRSPEVSFAETHRPGEAIVPQIEKWAREHGVPLELGWKVELAKRVKRRLLLQPALLEATCEQCRQLFAAFQGSADSEATPRASSRMQSA